MVGAKERPVVKKTGSACASIAVVAALGFCGAGAIVSADAFAPSEAHLVSTAQAKALSSSGTYVGFGNGMPSVSKSKRISKAWISKGKLHVKGKVWKSKSGSRVGYKKGTYTFRLSKKCAFGVYGDFFDRCSKKEFAHTWLSGLKMPQLNVEVKRGKAVRVYAGS